MRLRQILGSSRLALASGALLAISAGACNWMEFDDIAKDTWVDTTGAPGGVNSSDFALGLAEANNEAASPAETKQLAVISRSDLTLAFVAYDAAGKLSSRQTIALSTSASGPFDSLPASPIYASDPRSGKVAVASVGKVAVGDPSKATLDSAVLTNSVNSAGVTFLQVAGKTYVASSTERGTFLVDPATSPPTVINCTAPAAISRVVALGTISSGGAEQLVIWYQNSGMMRSELAMHTVAVAGSTCTLTAVGAPYTDLSLPNRDQYPLIEGARIVTLPGGDSVAVSDPIKGQVTIHKSGSTTVSTVPAPNVASLAVGQLGADTYLFAGSPNQEIDGVTNAGRVQATLLTAGVPAATPALTLYDSSPDTEQRFGRAVALVPFTDATSPIVVVGADDEMFSYFRTALYSERRTR